MLDSKFVTHARTEEEDSLWYYIGLMYNMYITVELDRLENMQYSTLYDSTVQNSLRLGARYELPLYPFCCTNYI